MRAKAFVGIFALVKSLHILHSATSPGLVPPLLRNLNGFTFPLVNIFSVNRAEITPIPVKLVAPLVTQINIPINTCTFYISSIARPRFSPVPVIPPTPQPVCINRHVLPNFEVPGPKSPWVIPSPFPPPAPKSRLPAAPFCLPTDEHVSSSWYDRIEWVLDVVGSWLRFLTIPGLLPGLWHLWCLLSRRISRQRGIQDDELAESPSSSSWFPLAGPAEAAPVQDSPEIPSLSCADDDHFLSEERSGIQASVSNTTPSGGVDNDCSEDMDMAPSKSTAETTLVSREVQASSEAPVYATQAVQVAVQKVYVTQAVQTDKVEDCHCHCVPAAQTDAIEDSVSTAPQISEGQSRVPQKKTALDPSYKAGTLPYNYYVIEAPTTSTDHTAAVEPAPAADEISFATAVPNADMSPTEATGYSAAIESALAASDIPFADALPNVDDTPTTSSDDLPTVSTSRHGQRLSQRQKQKRPRSKAIPWDPLYRTRALPYNYYVDEPPTKATGHPAAVEPALAAGDIPLAADVPYNCNVDETLSKSTGTSAAVEPAPASDDIPFVATPPYNYNDDEIPTKSNDRPAAVEPALVASDIPFPATRPIVDDTPTQSSDHPATVEPASAAGDIPSAMNSSSPNLASVYAPAVIDVASTLPLPVELAPGMAIVKPDPLMQTSSEQEAAIGNTREISAYAPIPVEMDNILDVLEQRGKSLGTSIWAPSQESASKASTFTSLTTTPTPSPSTCKSSAASMWAPSTVSESSTRTTSLASATPQEGPSSSAASSNEAVRTPPVQHSSGSAASVWATSESSPSHPLPVRPEQPLGTSASSWANGDLHITLAGPSEDRKKIRKRGVRNRGKGGRGNNNSRS
ncbi:hypothetical protein H0H93_011981 [Arthromyces matolae]|nr:hypothetical protein H0H93_011981 [Arthromyces matolae]